MAVAEPWLHTVARSKRMMEEGGGNGTEGEDRANERRTDERSAHNIEWKEGRDSHTHKPGGVLIYLLRWVRLMRNGICYCNLP